MNQKKSKAISILLVDDHPIVRHGLAQLINEEEDFWVCGEADGGQGALESLSGKEPSVVIVDLNLKDMSGLDLIKQISARYTQLKILVLSMHDEKLYAERALRAGAHGYIMKQEATDNLVQAIRKVMQGEIYLSPKEALRLASDKSGKEKSLSLVEKLSDRELEVFELLGIGLSSREMAEKLYVSIKTIETYRAKIKEKLNLKTNMELIQQALQHNQEKEK